MKVEKNRDVVTYEVDWLAFAIGNLGGFAKTAAAVGVSRDTISRWLNKGLLDARVCDVLLLAKKSTVPVELLLKRTGPPTAGMVKGTSFEGTRLDPATRKHR
jgi:hypothetical protein